MRGRGVGRLVYRPHGMGVGWRVGVAVSSSTIGAKSSESGTGVGRGVGRGVRAGVGA